MPSPVLLSAPRRQLAVWPPSLWLSLHWVSRGHLLALPMLLSRPPTISFGKISPGSRAKSRLCKHSVPSAALPTQRKVTSESEKSLGSCD